VITGETVECLPDGIQVGLYPQGVALICTGTVLAGRYRIEQHIASGGMGDVWQGYDRVLGRTVAVKCLRAPALEPAFVDRFRGEARVLATVDHPGVVDVYDFGEDPEFGVYLVMRYVDGESLAHALAREERLDAEATMRLVAEAADALHAAHEKGVTHRDVKPGNLLLRRDGATMITDFGIARSASAVGHTLTGTLLGSASYIAPERASGRPATARSDIYSLGIVAYQCLTGQLPFAGDSPLQIALRHASDDAPPLPEEVPAGVREVVERAMAKDPAARWPSAAALAVAARRAIAPAPARRRIRLRLALPAPGRRIFGRLGRQALSLAAAAALAVAFIAASVLILGHGHNPPADDQAAATPGATNPAAIAGPTGLPAVPAVASPAPSASGAAPTAASTTPPAGASASTDPMRVVDTVIPAMPTNLTATPVSASTIRLRWTDNSTDENGFTVTNGFMSQNTGANATTFDWGGLTPGARMCFRVRSFNAAGVSAFDPTPPQPPVCAASLPVTATGGAGPAAPSNLVAIRDNANTIRLTWTDNSTDESGFTITNTTSGVSQNAVANATTFYWGGLTTGTTVCFRIHSFNSAGVSADDPAPQQAAVCATP
jgi:tRNA A-37 threonylcarbamoyl transferase component Bud32